MSSNPLIEEPAIKAALALLTLPPQMGGTRRQIDKWLGQQQSPEMTVLTMIVNSPKVRRHCFVRLTGFRSRPIFVRPANPWETFFQSLVGADKSLGTRQIPRRLSVDDALTMIKDFRDWKNANEVVVRKAA